MLLNVLQCTGLPPTAKNYPALYAIVQRLKSPALSNTSIKRYLTHLEAKYQKQ